MVLYSLDLIKVSYIDNWSSFFFNLETWPVSFLGQRSVLAVIRLLPTLLLNVSNFLFTFI